MPSENGLIFSDEKKRLLELSWEIFYGTQSKEILGNDEHVRLFHQFDEFPLRINFLDTIDGGNLALQTTPSFSYVRNQFGEKMGQDEAFYVVRTKQSLNADPQAFSCIFFALHSNVIVDEFHQAICSSFSQRQDFPIGNYVQCHPTRDHDFFLLPHGTIHALGRNQLVLEISSAPRIYSLKLYDWLRVDFDGRPRHLSIEHGLKNVKVDRRADELRSEPFRLPSASNEYVEEHLPTHSAHFYDVRRLIIEAGRSVELVRRTENRFQLGILIEGEAIELRFDRGNELRRWNKFETFLLPASIDEYSLRPTNSSSKSILLFAFLKTNCETHFQ